MGQFLYELLKNENNTNISLVKSTSYLEFQRKITDNG